MEEYQIGLEAARRAEEERLYRNPAAGGVGGGPWPFDWRRALSEGSYRGFIAQSLRGYDEELYGVGDDHRKFSRKWLRAAADLYEEILDELARLAGHGQAWRAQRNVFTRTADIRGSLRKRK